MIVKLENYGHDINPRQNFEDGLAKLNLGCGKLVLPGFVNLDYIRHPGVNVICNVEKEPLNKLFRPGTFDFIFMKDILEHLPHRAPRCDGEFLFHLIDELLEISKDGALWQVVSPRHPIALRSGGHTRLISSATFDEYTDRLDRPSAEHRGTGLERVSSRNIIVWNIRDLSRFGRMVRTEVIMRVVKTNDGGHIE